VDIQRVILILGLAITSYLLVLSWNEDYGVNRDTGTIEQPLPDVLPITDVVSDQLLTAESSEISELPSIVKQETNTPAAKVVSKTGQQIRITTDVLDVWVNTVGGDIVRVDLPKYPQNLESTALPFVLLDPRNNYVAQSGLIGTDGPDAGPGRAMYSTRAEEYVLEEGETELIVDLNYFDNAGLTIIKRYRFQRDSYLVNVEFLIENNTDIPRAVNLFAQIKRDGQVPATADTNAMGLKPFVGGATFSIEAPYNKLEFEDLEEEPFRETVQGGYIAMVQHYFVSAWVPVSDYPSLYQARKVSNKDIYLMGFTGPELNIAEGGEARTTLSFYAGPKNQHKLKEIAKGLDLTVDYGFLWWIAQPLFSLLNFIHGLVGNWGLAIIILTIIVKMLLYPLSAASFKSMAKMRKLQPEMQRLKERYGEDRQKFSQAMMDLYKKEGANPLGGCLPMLLQMPVFLALYWTLMESVELRQAPLALWIKDLSIMDPYFVLPILMGISMFLTQMMQPEPPDPVQAKVMKLMPVMFTFFFLWFPSGLVLYWLVNNIISVLQQWYVTRQVESAAR